MAEVKIQQNTVKGLLRLAAAILLFIGKIIIT